MGHDSDVERPVRRTYGKRASVPSSPPPLSLLFSDTTAPSSSVVTPPSSPLGRKRHLDDSGPASPEPRSPLFDPLSDVDTNTRPPTAKKQSTLHGFVVLIPKKRARLVPPPSAPTTSTPSTPTTPTAAPTPPASNVRPKLTQLHFTSGSLRTCPDCAMSWVRGADDTAHAAHHARVTRGIPWDGLRGAGRPNRARTESGDVGWRVVDEGLSLEASSSTTSRGMGTSTSGASRAAPASSSTVRLIVADGSWGGARLDEIYATVDTVLSAPPLPREMRERCKLVLAVTAAPPPPRGKRRPLPKDKDRRRERDRIVGVVVAQPIRWAMRVLRDGEHADGAVDSGDGVICDPKRLPTPLGIHRLFTVPAYRGCGLGTAMLDAAAQHTVYGCAFDPTRGEVAFSQPTESGRRRMDKWGNGAVRVFVDDESQL